MICHSISKVKADFMILTSRPNITVEFPPVIQHGDSRRPALEEWRTSSRAKTP